MTNLLRNAKDPHMALLIITYCAMPLELCGLIPAELLMAHMIIEQICLNQRPVTYRITKNWAHIQNLKEMHEKYKPMQEKYSNSYYNN